jgi:hypothetical protein
MRETSGVPNVENRDCSRRDLLVYGSLFGWLPFFRPKHIGLVGAHFRIHRRGSSDRRYVFLHGNEETARQVLLSTMRWREGVGYEIQGTTRNVPIGGGEIDPNRMFSRAGAERNLKSLNPNWSPQQLQAALDELDRGRPKLVEALLPESKGLTVALHNNSETYSVLDEVSISDDASLRERDNPHAFYLCTDPSDFKLLSGSGYNVVLQQKGPPDDDGSLSRLAAARGHRYVNLEVREGNSGRQREMLDWLEWVLP